MKEGLELLNKLQNYEDNIVETKSRIKEIPLSIKKLEDERESRKKIINDAKTKLDESIKTRNRFEKDIALIKEKISKYREQLNKSTTNKEYQGFISEIKFEEERILTIEENIIEEMLNSDLIMDEIREKEKEFETIADDYNKQIKELEHNMDYHNDKLKKIENERDELRNNITKDLLRIFDNLMKKKGGKAISIVETDFCGICNVKVRPQRLNELITTTNIFYCENCGRLLFKIIEEEKNPDQKQ